MAEANSYEEQRRRQMEGNRRKLDELRLHHLSAAVREAAAKPKPRQKRKKAPAGSGEDARPRRSDRVAGLPEQPNYHEDAEQSSYPGVYATYAASRGPTDEERAGAVARAEELRNRLDCSNQPAFVKPVTQAYVTSTADKMHLPARFSEYLPRHGETVVLMDEVGDEFGMLYNANRPGKHYINAGWRGFVVRHELADGDCLVFQLTERTKFKVYIIRARFDYENNQTSDDEDEY